MRLGEEVESLKARLRTIIGEVLADVSASAKDQPLLPGIGPSK